MTAHHLCLEFAADGQVHFYPHTDDAAELAQRLAKVIRMFVEHPSAVHCAAGHHLGIEHDDQEEPLR